MKGRYSVTYSRIVTYSPIEVEADTEDEAIELVREMADKGELYEDDVEDDNIEAEEV